MKNNLPFFSHDNDALSHPKIQALVAEYGMAGYGMFWGLIEFIAQSEEACLNISKKVNRLCLANRLFIKPAELDAFLAFLADPEIDLINYVDGIITTDRTTENYCIVKERREVDRLRKSKSVAAKAKDKEKEVEALESCVSDRKEEISAWKKEESKAEQKKVNDKKAAAAKDVLDLEASQDTLAPTFDLIKTHVNRIGIKIDYLSIQRIAQLDLPAQYINGLEGRHTFFDFIIQKIKNNYKGKKIRSLSGLFVMFITCEDIQEQYPAWYEEQIEKEKKEKKERERQIALFNKPKSCECGSKQLRQDSDGNIWCSECKSYYTFNNTTLSYEFTNMKETRQQYFDFTNVLKKLCENNKNTKE